MLSPLFTGEEFFDDNWDLTTFARDAEALTDMAEFWADFETEVDSMAMVSPASMEEETDWTIPPESEEHKEKLVHHDCMWTGFCADSGHPSNTFVPAEPVTATPGQSLLRRCPSPPRPETPPSLDEDEPPQFQHIVDVADTALRLLRDSAAVAADHSYTLAKPASKHRLDNLGVQTPSDSEEEIDVVGVSEKAVQQLPPRTDTLPHVPSALDRHHIQKTVESAMSPRHSVGRKRNHGQPGYTPPRKRTRGPGRRPRRSSPDTDSDTETPDHEKRSLHNDMERMRRIGLKNLFDQLKEQIPSIRDKERAPKVVILREAATLCRRLQAEEREREMLKRSQAKMMAKIRKLRKELAPRYQAPAY